jgi:protein-tyrosine phosphatase
MSRHILREDAHELWTAIATRSDDVGLQDISAPDAGQRNTVLFLCTGNFYRSRFAEIYFNWLARRDNLTTWTADSRGLALDPLNYGPISMHTRRYLGQMGIPLPEPLRLPIDAAEADFRTARLIVALKEAEHRPLMQRRFPNWVEQVEYWSVHDLDCASSSEALPQVQRHVEELYARLHVLP